LSKDADLTIWQCKETNQILTVPTGHSVVTNKNGAVTITAPVKPVTVEEPVVEEESAPIEEEKPKCKPVIEVKEQNE
jgi:hypothetical protein